MKVYPEPKWICRFRPTDEFHEVGCPHKEWTKEELWDQVKVLKWSHDIMLEKFISDLKSELLKPNKE